MGWCQQQCYLLWVWNRAPAEVGVRGWEIGRLWEGVLRRANDPPCRMQCAVIRPSRGEKSIRCVEAHHLGGSILASRARLVLRC